MPTAGGHLIKGNSTMALMRSRALALTLTLTLAFGGLLACATGEQSAGLGALTGALVGAGVGYAIDDSAEGAIIGGLAGALAGGVIGYIVGEKLQDRDQTLCDNPEIREVYEQPGVDEVLDIRRLRVTPDQLRAGERVEINVIHSYVGAVDRVQPFEIDVTIVDDKQQVVVQESQTHEYENGTYSSRIELTVPEGLAPGSYGVDVSMRTGGVVDNQSGLVRVI
jgi:outer membrane lipoprotein SlyB